MPRAPEFWNNRGMGALLLAPLGALYGASVALKAALARPYKSNARVICIGNLTAGGSGKTPVALAVAAMLRARSAHFFFLTRGYGGSVRGPQRVETTDSASVVGDEALLLARAAPTILAADRAAGARLAEAQGARILVMDDGYQNFTLAKDVSIVVVDGEIGFGNGLMIPAGPLRETVKGGLGRADAVIVMGDGAPDLEDFSGPVLRAHLVPESAAFQGQEVFAFAGIGRPEKFVASLAQAGATVMGKRFFPDHHVYGAEEIARLRAEAGSARLVTTEKDHARLGADMRAGIATLPVKAVFEKPDILARLLDRIAAPV